MRFEVKSSFKAREKSDMKNGKSVTRKQRKKWWCLVKLNDVINLLRSCEDSLEIVIIRTDNDPECQASLGRYFRLKFCLG